MTDGAGAHVSRSDAWKIGRMDAHDQAALLRSGQVSAGELVTAAILRIEELDPVLNAITHRAFDAAVKRSGSPGSSGELAGVPYLLKDGLDYPGMPSPSGSRSRANAPVATEEYEYTRRLDAAGLIPLGKSNAPEFGLLPTTESILHGPAHNPWSMKHSPGGSSGGAAVAVASGMVPLAHAADGGGSIRIPASCCGVFGLKPGRGGSVRARSHHVIEDLLVTDTLLSRTVRDAAWVTGVAQPTGSGTWDPKPGRKRLRIALAMNNLPGDAPHPDVANVIRQTADLCANLGHVVEETVLPIDGPAVARAFQVIWGYLATDVVQQGLLNSQSVPPEEVLEPWTLDLARWARRLEPADLQTALEQITQASADLEGLLQTYDMFLSPVLKTPPVEIGCLAPTRPFEDILRDMFDYVSYTPLQNLTGTPSMSVPLLQSASGLPIGSMFTAAKGREATLLALAYELEAARPWADRWPVTGISS